MIPAKSMINILYLGGYSQSGKTTVINKLESLGWCSVSTSRFLTKHTLIYYGEELTSENIELFESKTPIYNAYFYDQYGINVRDAKIYVAESVIVPEFGRLNGLVKPAISEALPFKTDKIVCEVFNQEELILYQSAVNNVMWTSVEERIASIRRHTELTGIDKRSLVGANIQNDGDIDYTISQLLELF